MTTEERDLRNALGHIAAIAHCGGLTGMSEQEALTLIRRLTIKHWDTDDATHLKRVNEAISASDISI